MELGGMRWINNNNAMLAFSIDLLDEKYIKRVVLETTLIKQESSYSNILWSKGSNFKLQNSFHSTLSFSFMHT